MLKSLIERGCHDTYNENKEKFTTYLEPTLAKRIQELMPIYCRSTFSEMVHLCIEYGRFHLEKEAVEQGLLNRYNQNKEK